MANDIELRKLASVIANLEKSMDRQTRVLQALTKEIQRGNQAAEARSRRTQTPKDDGRGEEHRDPRTEGGSGEEVVQRTAPSSGEFAEAQQRHEGQKVAVNVPGEGRVFMTQVEATAYFESKRLDYE